MAAEQSSSEAASARDQDREADEREARRICTRRPGSLLCVRALEDVQRATIQAPTRSVNGKREPERANESPEDSACQAVRVLAPGGALEGEGIHASSPLSSSARRVVWAWSIPLVPGGALPRGRRGRARTASPSRTRSTKWSPSPRHHEIQGRGRRSSPARACRSPACRRRARTCAPAHRLEPEVRGRPVRGDGRWSWSARSTTCICALRASIRPEMPCVTLPSCWLVRPGDRVRVEHAQRARRSCAPARRSRGPAGAASAPAEAGCARSEPSVPGISRGPYAASATAAATIARSEARAASTAGLPEGEGFHRTRLFPAAPLEKLWRSPVSRVADGSAKRCRRNRAPTPPQLSRALSSRCEADACGRGERSPASAPSARQLKPWRSVHPLAVRPGRAVARDALLEQAARGGREAVGQGLAHRPRAEAEVPVVERPAAGDGRGGRATPRHRPSSRSSTPARREAENDSSSRQAALSSRYAVVALGAAASRRPTSESERLPSSSVGDREAHEERVPFGAVVQVGDAERGEVALVELAEGDPHASAAAVRRGGRSRSPRAARRRPRSRRAGALGCRGSRARRACRQSAHCRSSRNQHERARAPSTSVTSDSSVSTVRGAALFERTRISGKMPAQRGIAPHVDRRTCRAPLAGPARSRRRGCPRRARSSAPSRRGRPRQLARRGLEQRRLADAALALDQHQLAAAVAASPRAPGRACSSSAARPSMRARATRRRACETLARRVGARPAG